MFKGVIRRSFLLAPLGALAVGLVLVPAAAPRAEEPAKAIEVKGDLKTVQGEWVSKDESGESHWVFKGDHVSLKTPNRAYEMTVKLDADAKPEKAITFHVLDNSPNAKGADGEAIYKLDGEKFSICLGIQDNGRPKEFKNDLPNSVLFELKRK